MDENLEYMTEMKSKSEYRLEKFKKNHNYDPYTGTVELGNKRVKFKYTGGKANANPNAGIMKATLRHSGETVPEESILLMDKATFNSKHPTTPEFIANHERGHLGAAKVKFQNPKAYEKATAKYQAYINNLKKRGKDLPEHDADPEEFIADDVGRQTTSSKTAKTAMKDLRKSLTRHTDKADWTKAELKEHEEFCKEITDTLHEMDKMLSDPGYYMAWNKIKADRDKLSHDLNEYKKSMNPNSALIKNINGIEARLKAIKANEKEDIKKNLPNAKFKYDRGKYNFVNPKK